MPMGLDAGQQALVERLLVVDSTECCHALRRQLYGIPPSDIGRLKRDLMSVLPELDTYRIVMICHLQTGPGSRDRSPLA